MKENVQQRLNNLAISGSGFVFDPLDGSTYSANRPAAVLIDALKAGRDRSGLIAELADSFKIGTADLDRDLDDFLLQMRQLGILPDDFEV